MLDAISRRGLMAGLAATAGAAFARRVYAAPAGTAPAPASDAPARSIAERLAAYVHDLQYADLDAATIEVAKAHMIDALGCGIAAFDEGPVRICRNVALAVPGGSTILGTNKRTTPDLAAFANGAAFRYYDMNDVYAGLEPGHPSDNISACLAVAEAEGATGRDLLLGVVLAYEIDCRLLDAAAVTSRGWDHPVYSLPAAALAAGKLMKLGPDQLAQAVNLAINGHIAMNQTRVQEMSDWKGVADADAARNGVFAAQLARGGLTGPAPIFEGHAGLFRQVSGPFTLDVDRFGGRGGTFKINECSVKLYPAQGFSLTAIPAAIEVARQAGDIGRITAIEIATTNAGYTTAGRDAEKWAPETKSTADHSLPFIVARAMLDGDITNDSYSAEAIHDPRVRALMKKITVKEDPALTAIFPKSIPNRITATLEDGRSLSRQVDDLPGFAGRPMQRADIERKFRNNAAKRWREDQMRHVLDAVWQLDRHTKLADMLGLFAIRA
jgi:2-methylcitrate dehydratase